MQLHRAALPRPELPRCTPDSTHIFSLCLSQAPAAAAPAFGGGAFGSTTAAPAFGAPQVNLGRPETILELTRRGCAGPLIS